MEKPMNTGTFGLYLPLLGIVIGSPDAVLTVTDLDDEWFTIPDQTGSNQTVSINGTPAVINSVTQALGPQAVVALVDGQTVNLNLTPVMIEVETGAFDTTYILFPGLPPDAVILVSVSLPLFPVANPPLPLCLSGDARVKVECGTCAARDICAGSRVMTQDHGAQAVLWVGKRIIDFAREPAMEDHRPIIFETGSVDGINPTAPIRLSPQHRVLIRGWRAELYFAERSILVPARALVNNTTIRVDTESPTVEYVHLLFRKHEVIWADDLPVESLFLGEIAMGVAGAALEREIFDIFPELKPVAERMRMARPAVRMRDARVLAS
jgi:Hint domain